jgi:hypothetical protein
VVPICALRGAARTGLEYIRKVHHAHSYENAHFAINQPSGGPRPKHDEQPPVWRRIPPRSRVGRPLEVPWHGRTPSLAHFSDISGPSAGLIGAILRRRVNYCGMGLNSTGCDSTLSFSPLFCSSSPFDKVFH